MFKCLLCGYASDWKLSSVKHMKGKHPNWRTVDKHALPSGNTESISDTIVQIDSSADDPPLAGTSVSNIPSVSGTTVHTNPNWMDDFKKKFQDLIVQKCSELTRDAFERNSDIKVIHMMCYSETAIYNFRM